LGINILLQVIELRKKKDAYLAIFKGVEVNIWGLKINQEGCRSSYRETAIETIFQSWA
jgi:hypothetical protein